MATNLPTPSTVDNAQFTKQFFNNYGQEPLEFPVTEVEAAIGHFVSRGFDRDVSQTIAEAILKQAKLDNLPVFKILDTISKSDSMQINALVAEILNNNRPSSSVLGYRTAPNIQDTKVRNVAV